MDYGNLIKLLWSTDLYNASPNKQLLLIVRYARQAQQAKEIIAQQTIAHYNIGWILAKRHTRYESFHSMCAKSSREQFWADAHDSVLLYARVHKNAFVIKFFAVAVSLFQLLLFLLGIIISSALEKTNWTNMLFKWIRCCTNAWKIN